MHSIIFELGEGHRGYYTDLETAVIKGKKYGCNINKVHINKEDGNVKEPFLNLKTYGRYTYYVHVANSIMYDPEQDGPGLATERERIMEERARKEDIAKKMIYGNIPKLGWCDYPKQFAEKCPSFTGIVKFRKLNRIKHPTYKVRRWLDCSSKHVEENYYAEYIGNHQINNTEFRNFDGVTEDCNGVPYPVIDDLWEFETDRYPFDDFLWITDLIMKVDKGECQEITEEQTSNDCQ